MVNLINIVREKRSGILYFLILLLINTIFLRSLFLFEFDSIGHNWDWGFPGVDFLFENLANLSRFSWSPNELGSAINLQSHFLINEIAGLCAKLFGAKVTVIAIIQMTIFMSFFSFKRLIDFVLQENSFSSYYSATLYAFSPFIFNEIVGGSWYMWVSYAAAPITILFFLKYKSQGEKKIYLAFQISNFFLLVSLQNFVIVHAICILYMFVGFNKLTNAIRKRYIYLYAGFLLLNLYWIIPFLYSILEFYEIITSTKFLGDKSFSYLRSTQQSIFHLFSGVGYLDRNFYLHSLPDFFIPIFLFAVFFLFSIIFFRIYRLGLSTRKKIVPWVMLWILFIFIGKVGSAPFGDFNIFTYQKLPFMALYRSPQHLVFGVALLTPIIIGFGVHALIGSQNSKYKKLIIYAISIIFFTWTSAWWIEGDFGSRVLREKKRDSIDFYKINSDFNKVLTLIEANGNGGRTLFMPPAFSPDFLKNNYQNTGQGGIAEYMYLNGSPTLTAEKSKFAEEIERFACANETRRWLNIATFVGVKYIYYRNDILPHHTKCGVETLKKTPKGWNGGLVEISLKNASLVNNVEGINNLYALSSQEVQPIISIPKRLIQNGIELEGVLQHVTGQYYQPGDLVLSEKVSGGAISLFTEALKGDAYLQYKKLSPIKYLITIENAHDNILMVFLEGYSKGWRLIPENDLGLIHSTNYFSQFKANGFANVWLLNIDKFCAYSPSSCKITKNNKYTIQLVAYYTPQLLFYFGGFISFIGLVVLVCMRSRLF
jgi:hypothetical protein